MSMCLGCVWAMRLQRTDDYLCTGRLELRPGNRILCPRVVLLVLHSNNRVLHADHYLLRANNHVLHADNGLLYPNNHVLRPGSSSSVLRAHNNVLCAAILCNVLCAQNCILRSHALCFLLCPDSSSGSGRPGSGRLEYVWDAKGLCAWRAGAKCSASDYPVRNGGLRHGPPLI
jgi:hypothetical protein